MFTGRLSGLKTSQLMAEALPERILAGCAVQEIVGGCMAAGGAGGAGGRSSRYTVSPTCTSSSAKVTMAVALVGVTLVTTSSPSETVGSVSSFTFGRLSKKFPEALVITECFCVSSRIVARYEIASAG